MGLTDVAFVVLVLAVALAWTRAYWGQMFASVPSWSWTRDTGRIRQAWIIGGDAFYDSARNLSVLLLTAGAVLASTGSLVLMLARRWRRPTAQTPFWRARRPGALASLMTAVALTGTIAWHAVHPAPLHVWALLVGPHGEVRSVASGLLHDPPYGSMAAAEPLLSAPLWLPRWLGFVIAGAWAMLRAGGTWRTERSTLDRLGRLVGVYWIVAAGYFLVFPL